MPHKKQLQASTGSVQIATAMAYFFLPFSLPLQFSITRCTFCVNNKYTRDPLLAPAKSIYYTKYPS